MSSMGLDQKSFPRLLRIPFILFVGIEQGTELCVLGLMGDILHFRLRSWEACLAKRKLLVGVHGDRGVLEIVLMMDVWGTLVILSILWF